MKAADISPVDLGVRSGVSPSTEAGAAGTSLETATRALDVLSVHQGQTLLIDGAAGGVGSTAIQLAIARCARVIGTGRSDSFDFIAALGATPVLYGDGLPRRAADVARVNLALDVAGKGSLEELITITGDPTSVLSLANFGAPKLGVRITMGEFAGEADGRHGLAIAAELSRLGRFHIPVQEVLVYE